MTRAAAIVVVGLTACGGPGGGIDAGSGRVQVALVPVSVSPDVDVLFLMDDSNGMLEVQGGIKNAFPGFLSSLNAAPGGLPNLHIGVVSSDLGTKGADDAQPGPGIGTGAGSCAGNGKAGNLQTNGSTLVADAYISDIGLPGGTRSMNYTGSLTAAFSEILSLGAGGCGFEQHLEAAKRALDNNPANAGFLRPSAGLAVIVIGDEDDCSMAHSSLLGNDIATLGPLQSFRCTRFGITCDQGGVDPDQMNQIGPKGQCHSNESSAYLARLGDYETFFKGLKPDPRNVLVGAIIGVPEPVEVEARSPPGGGTAIPALKASCTFSRTPTDVAAADPGVRIAQLARRFSRNVVTDLCTNDLAPALAETAREIKGLVGDPCLTRDIAIPSDCEVFDERGTTEVMLPECRGAVTTDCYTIDTDPTACVEGQHLRLVVTRSGTPAPDAFTSVRCAL